MDAMFDVSHSDWRTFLFPPSGKTLGCIPAESQAHHGLKLVFRVSLYSDFCCSTLYVVFSSLHLSTMGPVNFFYLFCTSTTF
mmetsp:Transcript_14521/g.34571  ORF Transcript_14521/g.34571 Transcript_14521/m.34571 type:complete len:82 (-) Transcript_14521:142-387(-)